MSGIIFLTSIWAGSLGLLLYTFPLKYSFVFFFYLTSLGRKSSDLFEYCHCGEEDSGMKCTFNTPLWQLTAN